MTEVFNTENYSYKLGGDIDLGKTRADLLNNGATLELTTLVEETFEIYNKESYSYSSTYTHSEQFFYCNP